MLEVLHEWLYAIRWLVLVLALIPLFIYGRVLVRMLFAGADGDAAPNRLTRPAMPLLRRALPVAQPRMPVAAARPEVPAGLQDAGIAGHQQRGMAKTAKLPLASPATTPVIPPAAKASEPAPSADDLAMEGLFGSAKREVTAATDATDQEVVNGSLRRKASRLEELGFHHGIDPSDPTKPIDPHEPPHTQTAELTNILERIDKFLAEDNPAETTAPTTRAAPATPAAPVPRPATTTDAPVDPGKKAPPLWARPDVMDEDVDVADNTADPPTDDQGEDEGEPKGQQKLF